MKRNSTRYLIFEGFKNVWSNRLMSTASIGVLVSCLLLTGAAVLVSLNIKTALNTIEQQNSITIYLHDDLATLDSVQIGEKIKNVPNVASCEFFSKEQAMAQYSDVLGDLAEGLQGDENPLPNAFHVTMEDLSKYEETVMRLEKIEGVDSVSDRSETAAKLTNLDHLVTTVGFWLVLLLSAVSLFIISNTISVTMYSRRLEISIMKSVGATDTFIQIPFIVEGISIGILSALLSGVILEILYESMVAAVKQIVPFTHISFDSVSIVIFICFLIAGVIFGLIGGLISIKKYLKQNGGDIIGI